MSASRIQNPIHQPQALTYAQPRREEEGEIPTVLHHRHGQRLRPSWQEMECIIILLSDTRKHAEPAHNHHHLHRTNFPAAFRCRCSLNKIVVVCRCATCCCRVVCMQFATNNAKEQPPPPCSMQRRALLMFSDFFRCRNHFSKSRDSFGPAAAAQLSLPDLWDETNTKADFGERRIMYDLRWRSIVKHS